MTKPAHKLCLSLIAALGLTAAANATTLTFVGGGATNTAIPSTFGDNASANVSGVDITNGATPNIDLTWSAAANGGAGLVRWEFYTDTTWTGVAQLNDAASALPVYSVTFTPTAGFGVQINSLAFFAYSASYQYNMDWSVVRASDSQVMTSGNTGLFVGPTLVTPTINFTASDSAAYRIDLKRNVTTPGSGAADGLAIDNLSFNQVAIPEPSTYGLLGAGALGVTALIRRRRKLA